MALPASRRPAYAQQLLDEESKQMQKNVLKFKINKPRAILDSVGSWYSSLSKKNKRKLTPKQFKRRVMHVCYEVNFDYDKLPPNWLDTLKENYKFTLNEKKRKVDKEVSKKLFPAYVIDDLEDEEEDDLDGMLWNGSNSKQSFKDELQELMSGSHSEFTITGITSGTVNESSLGESFRETRSKFRKRHSDNLSQSINGGECVHSTPKGAVVAEKRKRLIDLTNEPPPLQWIADAAKGIASPRILRLYSSNDMNVIFYDYDPTPAEYPRGVIVKNIHGVGFHWWHEEILRQFRKGKFKSGSIQSDDGDES